MNCNSHINDRTLFQPNPLMIAQRKSNILIVLEHVIRQGLKLHLFKYRLKTNPGFVLLCAPISVMLQKFFLIVRALHYTS